MYVLFTEVRVKPVGAAEDTNWSRISICGVIWQASVTKLYQTAWRWMRKSAEAACCIVGGGTVVECRVECLGASGEHTYMLQCVRKKAVGAGSAMLRVVDAGGRVSSASD